MGCVPNTQYFNRTEGKDGALFRGHYKAILVDADTHWFKLFHRNPLDAQIIRLIELRQCQGDDTQY